jgi:predicted Rossmann fold nucleotide-binding protein DprA/Smf involved in DNA uptake
MLTPTTQAVLLLTAHFSKPAPGDPKPLTPTEWGRFAVWLKGQGMTPEALLAEHPERLLGGWQEDKITLERICALLSRSSAMALALEKWQRAGLWVITRSDPEYPVRLKRLLKNSSPPLFFGCGDRQLLNRGGLAVVGSRNAAEVDLDFAHMIGSESAEAGYTIVSGGARGIDESAMQGALEKDGTVIGVLADRLLKAATSSRYRQALMAQNLVLMSPFNPEAGFDVGNAMARNKYVYCLADTAVVVHSDIKGGTWNGALENLKNEWVPLWVKPTDDKESGNAQLAAKGARWLPATEGKLDIQKLFERPLKPEGLPTLFDHPVMPDKAAVGEDQGVFELGIQAEARSPGDEDEANTAESEYWRACNKMTLYEFFLCRMKSLTEKEAKTPDQLRKELDISKTQLNVWLKRAMDEGKLNKKRSPVRYAWVSSRPRLKQATILFFII